MELKEAVYSEQLKKKKITSKQAVTNKLAKCYTTNHDPINFLFLISCAVSVFIHYKNCIYQKSQNGTFSGKQTHSHIYFGRYSEFSISIITK